MRERKAVSYVLQLFLNWTNTFHANCTQVFNSNCSSNLFCLHSSGLKNGDNLGHLQSFPLSPCIVPIIKNFVFLRQTWP